MRPSTDRFDPTHDYQIASYAAVLVDEEEVPLSTTIAGTVTIDALAENRYRCDDLRLADDGTFDLVPTQATDLLSPAAGNELILKRGIEHLDGTQELIGLGKYRIEDADFDDTGEIQIVLLDRAQSIIDAKFETPHIVPAGTLATDAIKEVIQQVRTDIVFKFMESDVALPPLLIDEQGDRWAFSQGIASSLGCELFFDGDGDCVLRPVPVPVIGTPDVYLVEGPDGVLIKAGRSLTRRDAFNKVIVTADNATGSGATVPRGEAIDDNQLSPTRYGGPFGKVPRFYSNEFVTTTEQCQDTAEGILDKELGISQQVSFEAVVDPRVEAGDVARIERERIEVNEDNIIDSIAIPLSAETGMTGQTRATRFV